MSDLQKVFEQERNEKLQAFENDLQKHYERDLEKYKLKFNALSDQYHRLVEERVRREKSQAEYLERKQKAVVVIKEERQLLKKLWEQVVEKLAQDKDFTKKFLSQAVASIPTDEHGNIVVGHSSASLVKELLKASKHEIHEKKDAKHTGFMYQSASRTVDARLEIVAEEIYERNEPSLHLQIFGA